jgi:O-antigen ligase
MNIRESFKKNSFIWADLLITLFILVVLVKYDYYANLAPDSILIIIQLGLFWFISRLLFFLFPPMSHYASFLVLAAGLVEAIWGLGQLYGYLPSKHVLFKTTGSFLNSGPYGGFIALILPLVLHYWLYYREKNKLLGYIFLTMGIICLLVFPATLSRTAWIAATVGCILVVVFDTKVVIKMKISCKRHRNTIILCSVIFSLLIIGISYGSFHFKKDSANGRLFIWKITTLAIQETSLKGVGLGGFPASYAKAQIDFFKSGQGTETEKLVAGSPEYAFNEYLKILLEQGLAGGILFLVLTILIIYIGIKNRRTGSAGSFLTLSVFAFASYPYYLWEFLVVWVLLGTICVSTKSNSLYDKLSAIPKRKIFLNGGLCLCVLLTLSFISLKHQQPYRQANREWLKLRPLYTIKAYQNVIEDYKRLYSILNYDQKFVFEYAIALNATKQYENADSVLSRGLQISCDPMFYNVKGRNYHEMGQFDKAEDCYINSTYLLPERIYPYYLLTKLYADSANFQPVKMQLAAKAVLAKEPKVHSMAINEMREEVRKILKEKEAMDD